MTRALDAAEYDAMWQDYSDNRHYGPTARHIRRLMWQAIAPLQFESVLDVGCGEGSMLDMVARLRPSAALAGVDLSPEAVALSQHRMPTAEFQVLDVVSSHLPRQFDLVVCNDVMEHVADDVAVLRNLRAMTRRWCLIVTLQGRMRSYERQVGHVRNYRPGELRAKMQSAGFHVTGQLDWGWPFYSPLYREVMHLIPQGAMTGEFGPMRRLAARLQYALFSLNSSRRGDYVICLGETQ